MPNRTKKLSGRTPPRFSKLEEQAAVRRVLSLLEIPGPSGDEQAVAQFIQAELKTAGADPRHIVMDSAHCRTPIAGNTGNLIYRLPGSVRGPRRLLMAHMDTVPLCVGCKPTKKGNLVRSSKPNTGIGADDRAGVAAILTAATKILRDGLPRPPLTFLWTIQEETGLHGARLANLSQLGRPKMAFNWDGGAPHKLTIGATGGYRLEIRIRGQAAHAGNAPEAGVSAISIAALAIADLQNNGWHGDIRKAGKLGTSNIGVIEGGSATNVVPDRVVVRAEARSHDRLFRKRIVREIEGAFQRAARQVKSSAGTPGKVAIDGRLDYESFCLPTNSLCVLAAKTAVESLGGEPELAIANGGLDANWLTARGIPTVSLGCGQKNQHMIAEALDVQQYLTACRLAFCLATSRNSDDRKQESSGHGPRR